MQRAMQGFHQDEEGHWVAELRCGHTQHVRHKPPFTSRPWVITEEGRAGRLGQTLDCVLCDRREIPQGYAVYRRTPTFTQDTVPAALTSRHDLKPGVWGKLSVTSGELELVESAGPPGTEPAGETRRVIAAGEHAMILPEVVHRVAPLGEVSFHVELLGHRE